MSSPLKDRLSVLMFAIIGIGAAHMAEQLIFGIEEFHMLRHLFSGWYALFPDALADHASVLLITIVFTAVSLMIFAMMRGGVATLMVIGLFGGLGVGETHHWIEAIQKRAYDPGLITSFAYVWVGLLIQIEVGRALHARLRPALASASAS